jgi:hypothetical protein
MVKIDARVGNSGGRSPRSSAAQGARTDLASYRPDTRLFKALLKQLGLDAMRAVEAQRIGTMPDAELERVSRSRIGAV